MTHEEDLFERLEKAMEYELNNETGKITFIVDEGNIKEIVLDLASPEEYED